MQGKIDRIGMWTWGGRIYHWKRYLDNMHAVGMNSVLLWHYHAPANAQAIQDYAHHLGMEVIWGFNWSWNSPICLDSTEDAEKWRDIVLDMIRKEYAPLNPDAICFQTGGTEFGGSCRLDCPVCNAAKETGVGPLFMKFAGFILDAVHQEFPELRVIANVHLGGMKQSYQALKALPASVPIMYEDIPGPGHHIEVPFAYNWSSDDEINKSENNPRLVPETVAMVEDMCQLRGPQEQVAFVFKGFPCYWGGNDPMLLDEVDLKALSAIWHDKWEQAAQYCEQHLDEALTVIRAIADSPAQHKTVLLLVEHGLWEYKKRYAAVLINEALQHPYSSPQEIISKAREKAEI